jgi:hypothetical protein
MTAKEIWFGAAKSSRSPPVRFDFQRRDLARFQHGTFLLICATHCGTLGLPHVRTCPQMALVHGRRLNHAYFNFRGPFVGEGELGRVGLFD